MKNLSYYADLENIGSVHWFRLLMSKLYKEINAPEASSKPIMLNIVSDLIEWQETGNPLFNNQNDVGMVIPNHGYIYKMSTGGSIPLGFVPEPSDDSDEIRKAMISHITCTEVKENNSTFLIHEPGKAF